MKKAKFLFHSQTERSLHENLFDESDTNLELINAIQKKDNTLISDAQLFDKTVKMLVSPVQGMPSFHLVSYLNKREQNLFVFHIAAFTLLCTTLALFGLLFLVMLYYFFWAQHVQTQVLYISIGVDEAFRKEKNFLPAKHNATGMYSSTFVRFFTSGYYQ